MKNHMLLMMGGKGTRLGADRPKQYIKVHGVPVFAYIVKKCGQLDMIDSIVIVSNEEWIGYVEHWVEKLRIRKPLSIVPGGPNRSESVKNGLRELEKYADMNDNVLIHDATHPYVDEFATEGVIDALEEYEGVTVGAYQYDTVYEINDDDVITKVLPRRYIVSGASPEAFKFGRIRDIYFNANEQELEAMTSAGAIALAHGIEMKVVPATVVNLKITHKHDMDAFLKMASTYFFEDIE